MLLPGEIIIFEMRKKVFGLYIFQEVDFTDSQESACRKL